MKILIVAGCLTFMSCQVLSNENEPGAEGPLVIRAGESFGECLGYCWHELAIDANALIFTSRGRAVSEQVPEKTRTVQMTKEQLDDLKTLIDLDAFERLDEQYGCPDCADGGAEWLEIQRLSDTKRVTFEYGYPPAGIEAIADTLRALRSEIRSELLNTDE